MYKSHGKGNLKRGIKIGSQYSNSIFRNLVFGIRYSVFGIQDLVLLNSFFYSRFRLPFPWLLYTIVNQHPVSVSADGIGCQIGMLFLMLLLVFLSILAFDWKMTKGMGGVMGGFYFIFVIVSLGFNYCWYICPIG